MRTRWAGWLAAIAVTLVTIALVILDITDTGFRHWWLRHALTTDTVSGLLVLLITVQVANQVLRRRQIRDRGRAVAAQAAIVTQQASRATHAVIAALDGTGQRETAADEFRTYMIMLLVGAPVLIDDRVARNFLEQAQHLGGQLGRALAGRGHARDGKAASDPRLKDAVRRLRGAAEPLLQQIPPEDRAVVDTSVSDSGAGAGAG